MQFGIRRMSSTEKPEAVHAKKELNTKGVDNQLQSFFAKRAEKNEDPNALAKFEDKVQKRMKSTRDSTKDGKYHKENVGDRGVDSELLEKLKKRKSKIYES